MSNSLINVRFYAAPADHSPEPLMIPPGIQLVEILTGGVVYFDVDGIRRPCRRGSIFWHIAGDHTICETTRSEPYRCLVLRYKVNDNKRIAPRVSFWRSSDGALEEFVNTIYHSFSNINNDFQAEKLLSDYSTSELLMHAYKVKELHTAAPVPLEDDREQLQLRKLMDYLNENLAGIATVEQIAADLKIPRNNLFALFKKHFQQSPHEYLQEKRLQHARTLLESSNATIKEIAGACGFGYIEVFHRNFVKRFGFTPKQYRIDHSPYENLEN